MNDDLDEEIIGSEEGFDEFVQKNTLGDIWRNSPLAKIGIVLVAVAVIVGVIFMFGGKKEEPDPSMLPAASEVTSVPGTDKASPAYIAAVEEANEQDLERAIKTGESTLPVPVNTPTDSLQLPEEEQEAEDPLLRWRRLQEERVMREMDAGDDEEPVTVLDSEKQTEAMKEMADNMVTQIQSILGRQTETKKFNYKGLVKYSDKAAAANNGELSDGSGEFNGEEIDQEEKIVLIPAGEIEYAQLLIEANSDVKGPVLVQLVSGPLRGARILGTFSVENDQYLTLQFTTLVLDGKSYNVSAIALDPETSLPGMATDVNHHYFQRIILPAASAFVSGFADAFAQTDATNITINTDGGATTTTSQDQDLSTEQQVSLGVKEAGDEISTIIDDINDKIKVTVKIHAGTPLGILFTEPVTKKAEDS